MNVRRIVTGHDGANRAVVVAKEEVTAFEAGPGATIWSPWRSDAAAQYPDDGVE